MCVALGNMSNRIVSNSHFGQQPGVQDMIIFSLTFLTSPPPGPRPLLFLLTFLGTTGPGRYPILFVVKFHMEHTQNYAWGPPEARDMTTFVKRLFLLQRSFGVMTMVEKSIKNYIGWYTQNAKRMNVGSRYQHIMIL